MVIDIEEIQTRDAVSGGSVFPLVFKVDGEEIQTEGMTHRSYLIAHAPITYEVAIRVFVEGNNHMPVLDDDDERASFFAVWAMLRAEYADAVLAVLK